jgi:hypothetical protein
MQLFGGLDIPSFVRIIRLNWIGYVNRTDNKIKLNQVFYNNAQGSRLRGRPKNRWWQCVQKMLVDAKLRSGKNIKKNRDEWEKSVNKRRPALICRRR